MKFRRKNAFTLVEILLVVGFITLTSLAVYTIYNKVKINNQVKEAVQLYEITFAGVQNTTAGVYNFPPEFSTVAFGNTYFRSIVPDRYIQGANLVNPFGGAMNIGPGSGCGVANCQLWLTMHEVPIEACAMMATGLASKYRFIAVGAPTGVMGSGTAVKDLNSGLAYSVGNAAAICEANNTGGKVSLTAWIYKFNGN